MYPKTFYSAAIDELDDGILLNLIVSQNEKFPKDIILNLIEEYEDRLENNIFNKNKYFKNGKGKGIETIIQKIKYPETLLHNKENQSLIRFIHWSEKVRKRLRTFNKEVLKRDNYKCTKCQSSNLLTVHHVRPLSKIGESVYLSNPDVELSDFIQAVVKDHTIDDGITLCENCHWDTHKLTEKR